MKRQLLLLLTCVCMVVGIYAQPTISEVSGTVADGNSITITGSSFGSAPNVVIFDDFESGTAETTIQTGSGSAKYGQWNAVGSGNPYYGTDHKVSGSKSFAHNFEQSWQQKGFAEALLPAGTRDIFLSWWIYLPANNNWPGEGHQDGINWKTIWMMGESTTDDDLVIGGTRLASGWLLNGNESVPGYAEYFSFGMVKGSWKRASAWFKGSTTATSNDGEVKFWELTSSGLVQRINSTGVNNLKSATNGGILSRVNINGYGRQSTVNCISYFDDVYIATGPNAQARIEIGDESTYSECTNLSILTPTSWGSNNITAQVNVGSFSSGTAYLFVIDKNGDVSSGKQITIDGSGVTTHSITSSSGTGGSISPSGSVQVAEDDDQSFTISPDFGYEISDVTVDGVSQGAISSYTFTDVQDDHTISASFTVISNDIIIDNGGTGTSQSGSWSSSTYFPGYYGSSYMYAPNATGHWYEWSTSLTAGTYEVFAWWNADSGRPADAVYDITHSGGTANVTGDQTTDGGQWNLLGTYTFGSSGVVRLNSSANGPEGACADAVKFVEVPTYTITASAGTGGSIGPSGSVQVIEDDDQSFMISPDSGYEISDVTVDGVSQGAISSYTFTDVQATHTISASFTVINNDIIIDNGGTGTSQSGSWSSSSYFPGYYGSSYMYAPNTTGHWYEWSTSLTAGTYEVYAWWTADSGRPADAVYDITHSGGTANVTGDQTTDGGQWNLLGTYTFGTTGTVRLNSSANGSEGACADAIKFVGVPTIENLALNKSVTVSAEPEPANPGTSAVDGIVTTRWSASGGFPQWLEIDLGDVYNINATELICYQDRAYQFTVDVKTTSGGAYTEVVDRSGNTQGGTVGSPIRDDFTETQARYVRINVTGADQYSGSWTSLNEIRVFGSGSPANLRIASLDETISTEPGSEEDVKVFFSSTGLKVHYSSSLLSEDNSEALVGVYNMMGQLVQQVPTKVGALRNGITCNSSKLDEGVYIVRIVTAKSSLSTRVMLIK